MNSLNVGLIGTGYIGKSHALGFRNARALFPHVPDLKLACVCDLDSALAESLRADFDFYRATTDWRDIISDKSIDLVSIATPNALHREMAVAAIDAGKHVYCEKPMGVSLDEAHMMAQKAEQSSVSTLLAYNYLRSPAFAHVQKLVRSGKIGRLYFFRGVCEEEYMADPAAPFSWRCSRNMAGTGALGDLGAHLLCLMISIMGSPKELVAELSTVIPSRRTGGSAETSHEVENDDVAHAMLKFDDGATASFTTSRVSWGRKNKLAFDIYGEKGSIHFDQERMNEILLFEKDAEEENNGYRTILTGAFHPPYGRFIPSAGHQIGFNDLKTIEIAMFAESIAEQKPLFPTFGDGIIIEKCIAAMVASAARRSWEPI